MIQPDGSPTATTERSYVNRPEPKEKETTRMTVSRHKKCKRIMSTYKSQKKGGKTP